MSLLATFAGVPHPHGGFDTLFPAGDAQTPRPQPFSITSDGHQLTGFRMPGRAGAVPIVFIHGSPGDWTVWARYLDHPRLQAFDLIAIDRPGFGASEPGHPVTDLKEQARRLLPLLRELSQPALIVGHSLGGSVALRLALEAPRQVRGVLSLAGAFAPQYESPGWYHRAAQSRPVQWLLPRAWVDANHEICVLGDELQKLDAELAQLRRPLHVLHGERDRVVDPRTVAHVQQRVAPTLLSVERLPDVGHYLLWESQRQVIDALLQLADVTAPRRWVPAWLTRRFAARRLQRNSAMVAAPAMKPSEKPKAA